MNLAELLHRAEARLRASGIDDAALEAELLLRHALGLTREALFARLQEQIDGNDLARFEALLQRRLAHEPSAYITGRREFYGLELECTPAALIPRPETELLVELALDWEQGTRNKESGPLPHPLAIDVGTGGGAIAIALAVHAPAVRVIGVDVSRPALALARRNAQRHGVGERVAFVQGELLSAMRGPCDLIVANLPYIATRTYARLPPEIREHEPRVALHAGRRGTAIIESLLASASGGLRPGGLLLAEHAWNQGRRLHAAAQRAFPNATVETRRDLAGHERVLVVRT